MFSVDMSDDDFIAFLKIKGVPDADCSKLIGNCLFSKTCILLHQYL